MHIPPGDLAEDTDLTLQLDDDDGSARTIVWSLYAVHPFTGDTTFTLGTNVSITTYWRDESLVKVLRSLS